MNDKYKLLLLLICSFYAFMTPKKASDVFGGHTLSWPVTNIAIDLSVKISLREASIQFTLLILKKIPDTTATVIHNFPQAGRKSCTS